eukprot:6204465-Pleurochrysis_carterae.AAC.1
MGTGVSGDRGRFGDGAEMGWWFSMYTKALRRSFRREARQVRLFLLLLCFKRVFDAVCLSLTPLVCFLYRAFPLAAPGSLWSHTRSASTFLPSLCKHPLSCLLSMPVSNLSSSSLCRLREDTKAFGEAAAVAKR